MKKADVVLVSLIALIVGFSFFSLRSSKAFGQTTSSSSSSGSSTTSSSSSGSSTTTSSSSGAISSTSTTSGCPPPPDCAAPPPNCSYPHTIQDKNGCTLGCGQLACPSPDGTGLDKGFTGRWQAKLDRSVTVNGTAIQQSSRIATLNLCVDSNGNLKGWVDQPGIFDRAIFISEKITDSTHVSLQLEDIRGRKGSLDLSLSGQVLNGTFSNGVSIIGNNVTSLNPQRACFDLAILPNIPTSNPTNGILNPDFTGAWIGDINVSTSVNGVQVGNLTRKVRLNLCSANGVLSGFVDSAARVILRPAFIISQTITDPTHVSLQLQDLNGKTGTLALTLNGTELDGSFSAGGIGNGLTVTFANQNRLNPGTVCIGFGLLPPAGIDGMKPTSSSSSSGSCTCK